MLKIDTVSVRYETKLAVSEASGIFFPGRISGLIGPNGAGKSTLLKTCVGLIREFAGDISYNDLDLRVSRAEIKKQLGYAPEDAELLPYLKGEEFLLLLAAIRNVEKRDEEINRLLDILGLQDKKDELIINYSHGMRQKISIAAALLGTPAFIILDEALNGLDSIALFNLKQYLQVLAQEGHTIILSSHILTLIADWCDPIYIINRGRMIKQFTRAEIDTIQSEKKQSFEELFISLIQ